MRLTLFELLLVIVVLTIVGSLLLPSRGGGKSKATLTQCTSNVKQVALAEILWANDHSSIERGTIFPTADPAINDQLSAKGLPAYYRALSNELNSTKVMVCPADRRKPAPDFHSLTTNNISYFVNMDVKSVEEKSTVLNGDPWIDFTPAARGPIVTLTTNRTIGWAKKRGHQRIGIIALADGSVMKLPDRELNEYLLLPSRESAHRLYFP